MWVGKIENKFRNITKAHAVLLLNPTQFITTENYFKMKSNKDFFDFGKEQLEKMKGFLEEFETQFEKGAKETKEAFEKDMKQFTSFMSDKKEQVKEEREENIKNLESLHTTFDAFAEALKKEVPKTKKAFTNYKHNILEQILALEVAIKDVKDKITLGLKARVQQFKIRLDDYRLEISTTDTPDQEKLNALRIKLAESVEYMKKRIDWEKEKSSKIDQFAEEISSSFENIKKSVADFFK